MNKIISLVVSISMFSGMALADCDFKTGIARNPDGTYNYTESCHKAVGQLVEDNKVKTQQVTDLNKAITLKDLALTKSDQRAQLWMDTSLKLETNIQAENKLKKDDQWIWFALGVLAIGAAEVGANQLRGR